MTFKEQMQERAEERYPSPNAFSHNLAHGSFRKRYIEGSKAALSSDLVKGLVDALEIVQQDHFAVANMQDGTIEAIVTALTNFKKEVKQ